MIRGILQVRRAAVNGKRRDRWLLDSAPAGGEQSWPAACHCGTDTIAIIVNTGRRDGVPATEQQPDMKIHRTRTWPWFLGAIIALTAAAIYPPFFHALLAWDEAVARWFNSIVGRNHMIDIIVSLINTDLGDLVIITFIAGLFAWHAFSPSDPAERNDRIAFWTFTTLAFIALYGFLGPLEGSIGRDSPGRVLTGWGDLRTISNIPVKVSKTHCFPSGHASAHFFFAFVALREHRRIGLLLLLMAFTFPQTRIITGAHWPTDNVGSFLVAGLAAALVTETPVARLHRVILYVVNTVLAFLAALPRRGLAGRIGRAWREFGRTDAPAPRRDRRRSDTPPPDASDKN